MKNILCLSVLILSLMNFNAIAQKKGKAPAQKKSNVTAPKSNTPSSENYGKTLNIGVGTGYYGNLGASLIMFNYEFDIAKNFTLAPFIGYSSHSHTYYWGNHNYPFRNYTYRQTVIPLGGKVAYYFDELLEIDLKWDVYAAASIGFEYYSISWESGYYGDKSAINEASPLFITLHIGGRYHISQKVGAFLDLASGYSSIGLSFKL